MKIVAVDGGNVVHMVTYGDYPKSVVQNANTDQMLDNVRDGMRRGAKGQLREEKKITLDGHPGREFTMSVADGNYRARIYLVNECLYQVIYIGPDAKSAKTDRFFDSFALTEGKGLTDAGDPVALKRIFEDVYAATKAGDRAKVSGTIKGLLLPEPEAWFKTTFGDEKGAALAAEYAENSKNFETGLSQLLADCLKKNQTDIQVERFDKADAPGATGGQKRAMENMKQLVPLYSVRLVNPGEKYGQHLWSFVFLDGRFHIVGKMSALR